MNTKLANPELAKAMQAIRRSSASSPHANRARYNRKRQNWRKEL